MTNSQIDDKVILRIPTIPRIHLVLFFLTVFTTLLAGALMEGAKVLENPLELLKGIPFSFTLMFILGTHEFGHYYYAQKHKVDATLPYFIPAPPFLFLIGTFGAFIKIKSPIYRKDALLQIGAAGPIAGFVIAVPALIIGLLLSDVVEKSNIQGALILGDSILMKILTWITHPKLMDTQDIMLHPIAFAGWIGLLVTMLNLLPIGQLDGGHVAYAMLGKKQRLIGQIAFIFLIPLSFLSINWLIWGLLLLILMRSVKHPPIQDIHIPLSDTDKRIGYICLLIFIVCFIPAPFKI
jgi:membrane-associated protease RseP (regulator of RpoE activity)|tara:strand:+ start:562 stop:1443 length:882 start_codon:yes stop_codon:yes gene_type:complete